jgi:hypothetical protein
VASRIPAELRHVIFPLSPAGVGFFRQSLAVSSDLFAVNTWVGNAAERSITNEVNLASYGGMVWIAPREASGTQPARKIFDTARGVNNELRTSSNDLESSNANSLIAFNTNGFTLGSGNANNQSGINYVAWTFRKAARFFDVVTWAGNGTANRAISHNLGVAPGMIFVKRRNVATASWVVWHRAIGPFGGRAFLNLDTEGDATTGVAAVSARFGDDASFIAPTSTEFTVGSNAAVNASGSDYIAYLFAHDTSSDGVICCGDLTTDGSGNATVSDLVWAPRLLFVKSNSSAQPWMMFDTTRGWASGADAKLETHDATSDETAVEYGAPTSSGFTFDGDTSSEHLYMAVRA